MSYFFSSVHAGVRHECVSSGELLLALRAGELQLVGELDVLVPKTVGSETFVAVSAFVNL